MPIATRVTGRGLLALFVLSGFAGLIYQSVWSHYLGLTLGHAAYAQSLVLAIYMGGMALGAWLISRSGGNWRRLILAYAGVEAVIGVIGLLFHPLFLGYTDLSQNVVLAHLHSEWLARLWQWSSAALLIAPQSVLLGMTFPLMSAGYLRIAPKQDGEILGGLYFTNSIGAAFGALICTFVLLPWIGMPGAVQTAGVINLLVAVLAALLARGIERQTDAKATVVAAPPARRADRTYGYLLLAAFVTGATSFVYEIGWVRLLNQALGTTVHSFELMLSAFILGLAFGGLWIRQRSARITDPVAATGHAQVWMGIAALLSLPAFAQSFRWVGWMMAALARNDSGYTLFSLGSAVIALLVMFPAAFFAGMTLPLLTMALLRRGHGEASIGRVYAANTLGAIVGVFFTLHVLIPLIGVRLAVTLAAVGDVAVGLLLLRFLGASPKRLAYALSAAVALLAVAVSLNLGRPAPESQIAGVFRNGNVTLEHYKVFYLRDGKTATVSVFGAQGVVIIATNGKPDASIQMRPELEASADEVTMRMAAALPLGMHASPQNIALIGWGSGLSTHTLLGSPVPRSIDSVEIERAMYDGARQFGSHVARAYTDPRSHPHFDDARTYFSTGNRHYDVILSEPSNPWVTGVASLFTEQFYRFLGSHLARNGLLVQWLQSYEIDDRLLSTMVSALINVFPHVDVYLTNTGDLLFVASNQPLPELDMRRLQSTALRAELARSGLTNTGDFALRRIGPRSMLSAYVRYTGAQPHSDFYPIVSLDGPRTRYIGAHSELLQQLVINGLPVLDVLIGRRPPGIADSITDATTSDFAQRHWQARELATALKTGDLQPLQRRKPELVGDARVLLATGNGLRNEDLPAWLDSVGYLAGYSIGLLPKEDLVGVWIQPVWAGNQQSLPAPAQAVLAALDAAARRDLPRMRPTALAALAQIDKNTAQQMREQLLVLAMLGAIGEHDLAAVQRLEQQYGSDIAPSPLYGPIRSYLMAWADQ